LGSEIVKAHKTSKLEKLVKISLEYDARSQNIHSIKITGDFFIHPEETIEKLESGLCGTKLDRESLEKKIQEILKDSQYYGFDAKSLADAILGARR